MLHAEEPEGLPVEVHQFSDLVVATRIVGIGGKQIFFWPEEGTHFVDALRHTRRAASVHAEDNDGILRAVEFHQKGLGHSSLAAKHPQKAMRPNVSVGSQRLKNRTYLDSASTIFSPTDFLGVPPAAA